MHCFEATFINSSGQHALILPLKLAQRQHHDGIHDLQANLQKQLTQLRVTALLFHRDQSHQHQNVTVDLNIQDVGTDCH